VSFYPGNAGTTVPTHLAMIPLFRPNTGEPLGVMDGRLFRGRTTVFKSVGLDIEDVAAARLMYEAARAS